MEESWWWRLDTGGVFLERKDMWWRLSTLRNRLGSSGDSGASVGEECIFPSRKSIGGWGWWRLVGEWVSGE